jgi:hypothetical protein
LTTYAAAHLPPRDGELFLYVNEVGFALPWIYNMFYQHRHGTARIESEVLGGNAWSGPRMIAQLFGEASSPPPASIRSQSVTAS